MQKFSVILVHLPPLVVQIIVADQLSELEKERQTLENDYRVMVQELERRKVRTATSETSYCASRETLLQTRASHEV